MKTKFEPPFFKNEIAKYLRERIDVLKPFYSQSQIAARMGLPGSSMLSMMKRGEAKVPLVD